MEEGKASKPRKADLHAGERTFAEKLRATVSSRGQNAAGDTRQASHYHAVAHSRPQGGRRLQPYTPDNERGVHGARQSNNGGRRLGEMRERLAVRRQVGRWLGALRCRRLWVRCRS